MASRRAIAVRLLFPKGFKRTPCFFVSSSAYERLPGVVEELQLWGKATCSSEQIKGMKHVFLEQVEIFLIVEKKRSTASGLLLRFGER